jgi:endonuclease YncB( thermonuclease family)
MMMTHRVGTSTPHSGLSNKGDVTSAESLLLVAIFALNVTLSMPAAARPAVSEALGPAIVIDGDTLEIGTERIRLEGIDAPEATQSCAHRWIGTWSCGQAATRELSQLVAGTDVVCRSQGRDKYGRMLGRCEANGLDINAEMVKRGFAWAFVKYSSTFVAEEAHARQAGIGIWQSASEPAWDFRAKRWQVAQSAAPEGCAIKGNITNRGRIYHMPWSPWYDKVRVEPARGERWFCSETEAEQAGFRAANPG